MGVMRKAESGVERAFQGMFGRKAKVNVRPVELAWKLVKEMEDARVSSLSRVFVPHGYTVYLCSQDWTRYESHQDSLVRQLQNHLLQHARKKGYSMQSAPVVRLQCDQDLKQGQFGIGVEGLGPLAPAEEHAEPSQPELHPDSSSSAIAADRVSAVSSASSASWSVGTHSTDASLGTSLFLRQGKRVQEFSVARVLIGRADEADFRLDDPNVSRRHAVLFWDRGRLYLRDLGSTNGTYLNGRKVSSVLVRPGDVIAMGATQLTVEPG